MDSFTHRFRQIHLDFHTSEKIADIGSQFDPDEFADTLVKARVNSINCFARGHHGYAYYDTKKFPERRHPHLTRELLREQIEACHKRDIWVPIYITVQWDQFTALQHPEWLVLNENGAPVTSSAGHTTSFYQPGFYRFLCLNSPYVDFLKEFTKDVIDSLPCDGTWFDIVQPMDCSCRTCRAEMEERGLDPADQTQRLEFGREVLNRFKNEMSAFVRQHSSDCVIFYNAGHINPSVKPALGAYTHFELESLPSGGWGYLHFPVAQRYARTLGKDCVGMTGKFHTAWGDFHSFKNQTALEYECFQMLAMGAKVCVGDQLHPEGKICEYTYELVGSVYEQIEKKEPWCTDAQPLSDIGVLTPEEFLDQWKGITIPKAMMGVTRILQEGGHQFDIIDSEADFSTYCVLILPDEIPVSAALAKKLQAYLADGGAVLASHKSGLNPEGTAFALEEWGVSYKGDAPYNPDFIVPGEKIGAGLNPTEHVMYLRGLEVSANAGSAVLAQVKVPYFNRTHEHFCSHRHTPSSGKIGYPGIVKTGRVIYFAHPIFTQVQDNSPRWCKRLLLNALDMLLPEPLLRHNGPSSILTTLNEQPAQNRTVLHLLHYIPERRNDSFDVIEDVIPLFDVNVSVRASKSVGKVTCVPEMLPMNFEQRDGRVGLTLPKLAGHQMIVLE